ncbi:MAG: restriction endonuclease subunit S [Candidatus Micrarchaeota archaeon]
MVQVKDYFDLKYGVNLEFSNMEEDAKGISFVARTEKNNGVVGRVKFIEGINPNPANTISVSCGGSVMASFLQEEPYYSGRDLYYLIPKMKLNKRELLYYCACLKQNAWKYSYGRQANKSLKDLEIPSKEDIPSWAYSLKINELKENPINSKKLELNLKSWKNFKIVDLFDIRKGERLVQEERINGSVPLITATSENNGVVDYISYDNFKENKKIFQDKLTIDMFFNVFYHDYKYFSDDNVHTLIPKANSMNKYIYLFIATILKKIQYKYDFGRQVRLQRLDFDEVKLPIDQKGNPDWQFMEDYIKSLSYSSNLE